MRSFTRLVQFTLLLVGLIGSAGCGVIIPYDVNRTRPDSPLQSPPSEVYVSPLKERVRLRQAILRQLPLGSTAEQIKQFLARNFRGVGYMVREAPASVRSFPRPRGRCVYIRPHHLEQFGGVEVTEIYLMLDQANHLREVIVYNEATWL